MVLRVSLCNVIGGDLQGWDDDCGTLAADGRTAGDGGVIRALPMRGANNRMGSRGGEATRRWACWRDGAAQESNLPSAGLRSAAGFGVRTCAVILGRFAGHLFQLPRARRRQMCRLGDAVRDTGYP